tara:strand:+ start:460 stop:762 length:303 start_codon:yes stop_codon:yes gene_type:complete
MTDNYDSGFDLVLSDDERKELNYYYYGTCLPQYLDDKEEDLWYGIQIGDRMFDLNVWYDEERYKIVCNVYECDWVRDNWQTNYRHDWMLTEETSNERADI